jgi:hypothetical protein
MVRDPQYVSQVYSYAAHREIQVPLFVITNGHYTAVYESDDQSFEPVLLISQNELLIRHKDIDELISKRSVARLLSSRLQFGWKLSVAQADAGYQPMNLDIGDINHDGMLEIVIALSENRIPVVDARGNLLKEIATDGWVWGIKCTHSEQADEAALIALQHGNGSANSQAKVLGIGAKGVLWDYGLGRIGSGFETLDRILVDQKSHRAIIGSPGTAMLFSISFAGELVWTMAVDTDFGPVVHLVKCSTNGNTFLATSICNGVGRLIHANIETGDILRKIDLRFRGTRIEPLDEEKGDYVVASADTPEFALVNLTSQSPVRYFELDENVRHLALAVNSKLGLIAVGGGTRGLLCFQYDPAEGRIAKTWAAEELRNAVHKMDWVMIDHQPRLIVGTMGIGKNAMYVFEPDGTKVADLDIDVPAAQGISRPLLGPHSSIRDVKVSDIDLDGKDEIVFISNNTYLYSYRP